MKRSLFASSLFLLLLVTACATHADAELRTWIGRSETDLFSTMGYPDERQPDGSGGHILTYRNDRNQMPMMSDPGNSRGNVRVFADAQSPVKITRFYVSSDGRIYDTAVLRRP
jgi:hypothetical protein